MFIFTALIHWALSTCIVLAMVRGGMFIQNAKFPQEKLLKSLLCLFSFPAVIKAKC